MTEGSVRCAGGGRRGSFFLSVTDVEDIVPWYQGADVVLFPTLMEEGFGFTAVEGMACGKPVIYYDQS